MNGNLDILGTIFGSITRGEQVGYQPQALTMRGCQNFHNRHIRAPSSISEVVPRDPEPWGYCRLSQHCNNSGQKAQTG